jgi:hypothetical protein
MKTTSSSRSGFTGAHHRCFLFPVPNFHTEFLIFLRPPSLFLPCAPRPQAVSSRKIMHVQAGQCGNHMGKKFSSWCATSTASAAAEVLCQQRRAAPARPNNRVLPRGLGWRLRSPRGALRHRAQRDRRCNPKSPLGELFRLGNLFNQNEGTGNTGLRPTTQKGLGTNSAEPICSIAAFVVNSEPDTGARPSVRLCVCVCVVPELAS